MAQPKLQQKAVGLVPVIMAELGDTRAPDPARQNAAVALVQKELVTGGSPQEKLMGALLITFIKTEYPQAKADYILGPSLKAFAAGEFDVAYASMKGKTWHVPDPGKPGVFDFSQLEGSRYTLFLATRDALSKQFGEEGEHLARTMAVCQSGKLAHTMQPPHFLDFHERNYVLQDADRTLVQEMHRAGVNPFKDVKIMEIGGAGKSYAEHYPLIGLFAAYDNINDNSGGYAIGAIPANPRQNGAISLSNFDRAHAYDYVVTSNTLSHRAIGMPGMPVAEKMYHAGDLFCTCANALKEGGTMFHLNAYDKERVPAMGDAKLHRFAGVQPQATAAITAHGTHHIYAYAKPRAHTVTLDAYDRWHATHARNWELMQPFELKANTGTRNVTPGTH